MKVGVVDAVAVDLADVEVGHYGADEGVRDVVCGAPYVRGC